MTMTHYEVLSVKQNATLADIKKAYKRLAIKFHPDKNQGDSVAATAFANITAAYDILSDETKRAKYDRSIKNTSDFRFFADLFDMGHNTNATDFSTKLKKESAKGIDHNYLLGITLNEAYSGCHKLISYERLVICQICSGTGAKTTTMCPVCNGYGSIPFIHAAKSSPEMCPSCFGSGIQVHDECDMCHGKGLVADTTVVNISIPKGFVSGDKIVVSGKGNAGHITNGNCAGPHGDLIVKVNIVEHDIFTRDGIDLFYDLPILIPDLVLGKQCKVPVISGGTIDITIPPLTKFDSIFRIKNRGMVYRNGDVGSVFVKVKPIMHSKISDDVKELYEKIQKLETIHIDYQ